MITKIKFDPDWNFNVDWEVKTSDVENLLNNLKYAELPNFITVGWESQTKYYYLVTKGFHQEESRYNEYFYHITVQLLKDDCKTFIGTSHYYLSEDEIKKLRDGVDKKYYLVLASENYKAENELGAIDRATNIIYGYVPKSLGSSPSSLFQGYDCISGSGLSTAIAGKTNKVGGTSSSYYSVTKSITELYEKLDVSASLSVGLGGFANISAKLKFVDELKLTEESICILVRASHILGIQTTPDYEFKQGAAPKTSEQVSQFVQTYGDAFISEIRLGAEYYAVYTFYSQNKDQKKNIDAELKANGIGGWGKVDSQFQAKLDSVVKNTNVKYAFNQNISGIENPKLPKPDDLVQYAIDFLSLPVNDPAVISFSSTGYEKVPNPEAEINLFAQIRKNRLYFSENSDFSKGLALTTELLNKIDQLREIYMFYNFKSDEKLNRVYGLAKTDLKKLQDQLHSYEDHPTQNFTLPDLPSTLEGVPNLQFKVSFSDERGGDGGNYFDDVNTQNYLEKMTKISEIKLYVNSIVERLEVTYKADGMHPETYVHGNDKGSSVYKLSMPDHVFIKSVKGRSGSRVDRLQIITDNGAEISGGGNGGSEFTFNLPAESNSILLGFEGRSGSALDKIRAVYATFQNASWSDL